MHLDEVLQLDESSIMEISRELRYAGEFVISEILDQQVSMRSLGLSEVFEESKCFEKKYLDQPDGKKLIICFQGFYSSIVDKHYKSYKTNNLKLLDDSGLPHSFTNFCSDHIAELESNFMFVKDNLQSWYQINLPSYIQIISREINRLKPSEIICLGMSAGGFAAILFSLLIGAKLCLTFSPQTIAFTSRMSPFRREIFDRFVIRHSLTSNLILMQQTFKEASPTIRVYYNDKEQEDAKNAEAMKHLSQHSIILNPQDGHTHNIIKEHGKESVFLHLSSLIKAVGSERREDADLVCNPVQFRQEIEKF